MLNTTTMNDALLPSVVSSALLGLSALLFGCTQPVSDSVTLGAEQTERALAGYNETSYEYPVQVPNTNRYVSIVVPEPLDYKPDYEDYLKWKRGESMARKAPPADPDH